MKVCTPAPFLVATLAASFLFPARGALVGYWRLDGDFADSTGRHTQSMVGIHFSWPTAATNKVAGPAALALNTNNNFDTWIQVANAADLKPGTNDFTISYWVKKLHSTAGFSDTYGVSKWKSGSGPGQNEWSLGLATGASDDKPGFAIEVGGTTYATGSPSNITLNTWHHLVGLRRQTAVELYVDGVFVNRATNVPASAVVNNAGRDLYIGASAAAGNFFANAIYDDVQLYDFALSNGGAAVGQTAGGNLAFLFNHPGFDALSPYIVTPPSDQAVPAGHPATFSVVATNGVQGYQWRLNATNLIAWGTNATLTITNVTPGDLGFYDVVITNSWDPLESTCRHASLSIL